MRAEASENLQKFVEYTKADWQTARHHAEIFSVLEALESGEITRLIIEAPPRHSKTETASRRFTSWYMGRNPNSQVVCSTYNQDFANDIGRDVRGVIGSEEFGRVFPNCRLRSDSKAADRFHTTNGSIYVAVGTGSALTGRGMNLGVIDDPFKDREEAESERTRNRKWDWFRSTFYTRQMPDAKLLLMACLTGDSRILLADGSERHLRDIVVGDPLCTLYGTSLVTNWRNCGADKVYRLTTDTGMTVRANDKHPFLVMRANQLVWVRVNSLRIGDNMVSPREGVWHPPEGSNWQARIKTSLLMSVIPDGEEDVYDIEVTPSENFVADGLYCHNTRWGEDDLTGRILEHEGDRWHHLKLPAISNEGQADEEALWPEWYPLETLYDIRQTIGARDWLSLYQQSPTSDEGTIFQREWFEQSAYKQLPDNLNYFMSGDFAVTAGAGDFTELALWGVSASGHLYAVDWWYGQTASDTWIERLIDMAAVKPVLGFVGETGQIRRAIEPMLTRRMRERGTFTRLIWLPHGAGSKVANSRSFQAMASMGRIHFPAHHIWAERIIDQLLKFPDGKLDDGVDTCSLMGRYMDKATDATVMRKKHDNRGIISDGSRILRVKDFKSKKKRKHLY